MLFRLAVCVALVAVCHAGLNCTRCNQARGEDEMICNTQPGTKTNEVECEDNEVCTIDVRCDGRDRPYWIKGCEKIKGITIGMDNATCQDNLRRCRVHCDSSDYCNEFAPPDFIKGLACTENVTDDTPDTTTPEPTAATAEPATTVDPSVPTNECIKCGNTEGEDAECNGQNSVDACSENQVCWARYKCRKQGDPGRGLIKKQCKNINQCENVGSPYVETKNVGGVTQFVGFLCCNGDNCNEEIVDDLIPLLSPFCDVPDPNAK